MKTLRPKFFALLSLALCSLVGIAVVTVYAASAESATIARYLQYKHLSRLTTAPIDVAESVRTLCRDPRDVHGLHLEPGIHLYANDTAIDAKKAASAPLRYPIGTLFVKEKFATKDAATPSLITVMEKIAARGQVDDWRFTMIRLADRSLVHDTARVSCAQCHARYTATDFVSHVTDDLLGRFMQNPPGK